MYVYKRSKMLWTLWEVGFYDPNGIWYFEGNYPSSEEASKRVAWLNGGKVVD